MFWYKTTGRNFIEVHYLEVYNRGKRMKIHTHLENTIESIDSLKTKYDKNVKEILSDIQVLASIINIEAQRSKDFKKLGYHLENRIIYYLARLISSQKGINFAKSECYSYTNKRE